MQQRKSNIERSQATRASLLRAGRQFFIDKGYAETSTPEIVAAARVTRGALYHHFTDKRDLFRAVLEQEAQNVAQETEVSAQPGLSPRDALLKGSLAYLDAMSVPGRTRLLLIEGPAVLGPSELAALDELHAARALREGLEAVAATLKHPFPVAAMTVLLSAAFDRAALSIAEGGDPVAFKAAMLGLVERVATFDQEGPKGDTV